jgi:hypothetical protein
VRAHPRLRSGEIAVRSGSFHYDGTVRVPLWIVRTEMRPGSGDYEDPPAVADDQPGTWFRVDYCAAGSDRVSASGGYFSTLDDAIGYADQQLRDVAWDE